MRTRALFFPFDLFGSSGTRTGVELLADAFQELLADNRRERRPTRARSYTNRVSREEIKLDRWEHYARWRQDARTAARTAFDKEEFLLWVTGNHLGLLPVYEELPPETLVLQFDAHLDIYNLSDCTEELSHGNFLLHAQEKLPRLVNVGHRDLLLRPDYIANFYERTFSAAEFANDPGGCLKSVQNLCGSAPQIFLDLDCDAFDPAYFPAAAHAQPFGISPREFLGFLEGIWSDRILGIGISEFEPGRDVRDGSLATLVWLLEYLLLKVHEAPAGRGK